MLPPFPVVAQVKFLTDNGLGLYLHIPFCTKKCAYCNFYSSFVNDGLIDCYTEKLIEKTVEWGGKINRPINSLYFGGGTPSVLGERTVRITNAIRQNFRLTADSEITLEINPSADCEKVLNAAKRAGINRLSIGAQSGDDNMLKLLGRTHTANDILKTVNLARQKGFNNISLDLMIGLPFSDENSLKRDLDFILSAGPEHISTYILKIEPNTAFFFKRHELSLPDDDEVSEQYLFTCDYLKNSGYNHYEISNFCKENFESHHNLKYWNCEEYLGIGPSAHSFLNGERFFYPNDLKAFLNGGGVQLSDAGGDRNEYIMLRLRLSQGLNFKEYKNRYGEDIKDKLTDICRPLMAAGLIYSDSEKIYLTDKGMLVSNSIIAEIISQKDDSI